MSLRRHDVLAAAAFWGALSARAALGFAPTPSANLEIPLAIDLRAPVYVEAPIATAFPNQATAVGFDWNVQIHDLTGRPHMAWGGVPLETGRSIFDEADAVAAARSVLERFGDLLGVDRNAEVLTTASDEGRWAVHFQQMVNGIPVERGRAFVFLGEAGNVIAMGSDFFPVAAGTPARPQLSAAQAINAAAQSISAVPRADAPSTADLVYLPVRVGSEWKLAIAHRVVFESDQPFGKWETYVDGTNGEILGRHNRYEAINVTGTVQGDLEDFGYCDGIATDVFENLRVNVTGGGNDVTDDNGFYDIANAGAVPVTVTAQFLGPFCNVNRAPGLGTDATFSGTATPGTPFTINWTNSNSRQDERDTFFHSSRAHDFMKAIDNTFNGLDYAMGTSVGRSDGLCPGNAWWDGSGINFCEASGTWANTGRLGNIVYHEYGHGVTAAVYVGPEPPSTLHEGNSDVLANLIDRQSIIGLGFTQGNCSGGIRDSDNNLEYPDDLVGEGHSDGQIIAGFIWDSWQEMLAVLPQNDADNAIRQAWHKSRKLGQPQDLPSQVSWTFLADDNDGNINNGTPHHQYLCVGATNHGFSCPAITQGVFITHTPGHHTNDGSLGFDIDAVITSTEAPLDAANLLVHYRVNGGSFIDLLMSPTGDPNEFSAHIPALNGDSELEYYISAKDQLNNTKTAPASAPLVLYAFDVAYVYDALETDIAGWQLGVGGDTATGGVWAWVDPVGWFSVAFDSYSQPEDDATPNAGTKCFVTGQCCNPCTQGCADVDGGTTTLLSPVYNLSGALTARIKYDRWYSSHTGGSPNSDLWTVEVSNDGGTNWVTAESTTQTIPEPFSSAWTTNEIDLIALFGTPNQVRMRFRARDEGSGSIVEAGVDEIRVMASFVATAVEDVPATAALSFSLSQNQPNPFSPNTRIDFALPSKGNVELAVYDVAGRLVRMLASGAREAGRYAVQWDGKDTGGKRVSAGVYFYRLNSQGQTATRKMTVLK
jgi:Zn-dependent metalloprotease